jgi:hypothetical protein
MGKVISEHKLLTGFWTADVDAMETAIGRFAPSLKNHCQVVLFEMAGDRELHVNVTHEHRTIAVRGWSGPGRVATGFVHNRRFGHTPPRQIIRHIRDMVFAARDRPRRAAGAAK